MEAADDIAYLCGDIEDAIKYGLIPQDKLIQLLSEFKIMNEEYNEISDETWKNIVDSNWHNPNKVTNHILKSLVAHCEQLIESFNLKSISPEELPSVFHEKIEKLQHCSEAHNLLYCDNETTKKFGDSIYKLKSSIYFEHILKSSKVIEAEYFSEKIIKNLFTEFMSLHDLSQKDCKKNKLFGMLPPHVRQRIEAYFSSHDSIEDKILARMISDYISGMTDRYAIYFWEKLNSPHSLKIAS